MQPIIMTPDDNLSGIQHAPKICVDYLSHDWNQEDIWTSWKVMSKQKKELSNGIRLENASWRTWAKQKYNLKTVNPNELNWLKDSDVTWLYGPLHTAWSNMDSSPKSQKTEDNLNLMPPTTSTKSCLKKKSISEILRPVVRVKYGNLVSCSSDSQLYMKERERESDTDTSDCETASTCSSIGPTTPTSPMKTFFLPIEKQNKKIQFNDRVEQCIAVESDVDPDDLSDSDDSDSSSDGGIVLKSSKKKKRDSLTTICKLAPTKLKEDRIRNNEYSSLYYPNSRCQESSTSSSPTTTQSTSQPNWMFDDDDFEELDNIVLGFPSPPSYQASEAIIPPPDSLNENNEEDNYDDDISIVSGVREMVNLIYSNFIRGIF